MQSQLINKNKQIFKSNKDSLYKNRKYIKLNMLKFKNKNQVDRKFREKIFRKNRKLTNQHEKYYYLQKYLYKMYLNLFNII